MHDGIAPAAARHDVVAELADDIGQRIAAVRGIEVALAIEQDRPLLAGADRLIALEGDRRLLVLDGRPAGQRRVHARLVAQLGCAVDDNFIAVGARDEATVDGVSGAGEAPIEGARDSGEGCSSPLNIGRSGERRA